MILLRHTTPDVAPGTCYGRTDLALADGFEAAAGAVLAALPDVTGVVSSPLTRCRVLAERIGAARGLPVAVDTNWAEMDFGDWEGRLWSALPRGELDAWAADFMGYRGHGGESVAALKARVGRGMARLEAGALVVTHMGPVRAVLAHRGAADAWEAELAFGGWLELRAG